jgi:predicted DsbA family dithiol-disulfide isomerase
MIEVFADICCPFTHVGLRHLVARRDQIGSRAVFRVKAWPLELVNGEPLAAALVAEEAAALRAQVAPDLFEGFDAARFPTTSLPALALAAAAYRRDSWVGERVSLALRDAVFEEGRDVGDPEVVAEIGRAHGVEREAVDDATVLDEWHEGERRGVAGSPFFFAGGHGFFCPSLEIEHVDERLRISRDAEGLERFLDAALS